jgi:hypothetical protein
MFGSSLMRVFRGAPFPLPQVADELNWPCVSFGRLYISVGIADVFHIPVAPSPDVLIIVATRNTKDSRSRQIGKVNHAHLIWT